MKGLIKTVKKAVLCRKWKRVLAFAVAFFIFAASVNIVGKADGTGDEALESYSEGESLPSADSFNSGESPSESAEDESTGDESTEDESTEDESTEDESTEGESTEDESTEDESDEDESDEDESDEDESDEDETDEGETGEDETGEDETSEGESGEDESDENENPDSEPLPYSVHITAPDISFTLSCEDFDLLKDVSAADENGEAIDVAVTDDGGFSINALGAYTVTYEAVHPLDGEVVATAQRLVEVLPEEEPEPLPYAVNITAEDISFPMGSEDFDLLRDVSATDENGEPVDVTVTDDGGFSIDALGVYTVTYGAVHPLDGEVVATAQRIVQVILPIMPLTFGPVNTQTTLQNAINTAPSGETILISGNINLTSALTVNFPAGKTLTFQSSDGTPYTIRQTSATANVRTMTVSGGNINLTFDGIIISGSTTAINGGIANSATNLTLNNAIITGCRNNASSSLSSGGGIFNPSTGTLTINGGDFYNNNASYGGVINNLGTATINGGEFYNNTATANNGGALNSGLSSTLTITGARFYNNTAALSGGGIHCARTLTITGVEIYNNTATNGGGVSSIATSTIIGCEIYDNTATTNGGGVWSSGNLIIGDPAGGGPFIHDNRANGTATANGGGGIYNSGTVTMHNGEIYNNTAACNTTGGGGGGIWNSGTLTINGGGIYANHATGSTAGGGGGIFNYTNATTTINGGRIRGNTAAIGGGCCLTASSIALNIDGGEISGNTARITGGGLWSSGGIITVSSGEISGNTASTNGGGIWIGDYSRLSVAAPVVFANNSASAAYYVPVSDTATIALHTSRILTTNFTAATPAFSYAYNNYDINYTSGTPAYLVTFNANGGTPVPTAVLVNSGALVTEPPEPDKTGHIFMGWYTDTTYTTQWDFSTDTVSGNMTLYALWSPPWTVTFEPNGGTPTPPDIENIMASTTIPEPIGVTKPGHILEGWYIDSSFTTRWDFDTDMVNGDMTLYARWEETWIVTFEANGGAPVPPDALVGDGEMVTEPPEPIKSGHTFEGWYTDTTYTTEWDFSTDTVTGDMTLYALWTPPWTVTFEPNGGTPIPPDIENIMSSTTITRPADPVNPGYVLEGWYLDSSLTILWDFSTDMVNGDMTLYAKWEPGEFTVTFESNGVQVDQYTNVQGFTTIPDPAYTEGGRSPVGWYTDNSFTTIWDFTTDEVTGDITLYAKWTLTHTVNFYEDNVIRYTEQVDDGDTVSAYALVARPGYIFMGWCTDIGRTILYDFSAPVNGDLDLYDLWAEEYTVHFYDDTELKHTEQVGGGDTVSHLSLSKPGRTLTGWYRDRDLTIPYSFSEPVTEHLVLYASWADGYTVNFYDGSVLMQSQQVADGGTATSISLVKPGYAFKGWYADSGLTAAYNFSAPVTADLALYARWEKVYTVSFYDDTMLLRITNVENGATASPASASKSGYTLTGWYTDVALTTLYDFTSPVTGNIRLYAKWEPASTVSPGGGGGSGNGGGGSGGKGSGGGSGGNIVKLTDIIDTTKKSAEIMDTDLSDAPKTNPESGGYPDDWPDHPIGYGKTAAPTPASPIRGTLTVASSVPADDPVITAKSENNPKSASNGRLTQNSKNPVLNALLTGDEHFCLIHWLMLLGILLTSVYAVLRLRHESSASDKFKVKRKGDLYCIEKV